MNSIYTTLLILKDYAEKKTSLLRNTHLEPLLEILHCTPKHFLCHSCGLSRMANFFFFKFGYHDGIDFRFEITPQKEVTAHTTRASMEVGREMISNYVISRFGDVPWLPQSPGLSVCFIISGFSSNRKSTFYKRILKTCMIAKLKVERYKKKEGKS